jgi:hypothetical protein
VDHSATSFENERRERDEGREPSMAKEGTGMKDRRKSIRCLESSTIYQRRSLEDSIDSEPTSRQKSTVGERQFMGPINRSIPSHVLKR